MNDEWMKNEWIDEWINKWMMNDWVNESMNK